MAKVYAIKEGFDSNKNTRVENLIVSTWNECLYYTKGVKGAKFKSFTSRKEAEKYVSADLKLFIKGRDSYPQDLLHLYVDGSYNSTTNEYSYGVVAVKNDVITSIKGGSGMSEDSTRQIAGELQAASTAIQYAQSLGESKVVLFLDYEGIFHHAVGTWERKDNSSKAYFESMTTLLNDVEVIFVKVDSHTGDLYNELVDDVCKYYLDIDSTGVVQKHLRSNEIVVLDNRVKKSMLGLYSEHISNIVIKEDCFCKGTDSVDSSLDNFNVFEEVNITGSQLDGILSKTQVNLSISGGKRVSFSGVQIPFSKTLSFAVDIKTFLEVKNREPLEEEQNHLYRGFYDIDILELVPYKDKKSINIEVEY